MKPLIPNTYVLNNKYKILYNNSRHYKILELKHFEPLYRKAIDLFSIDTTEEYDFTPQMKTLYKFKIVFKSTEIIVTILLIYTTYIFPLYNYL